MTTLGRIAAVAGFAMFASLSSAQAQLVESFKFTTAFPFVLGHEMLPAGAYTITADEDAPTAFCTLRGEGVKMFFAIHSAESVEPASKSEVVFTRFGPEYVLKSVWVQGSVDGIATAVTEPERNHVKSGGETRIPAAKVSKGT